MCIRHVRTRTVRQLAEEYIQRRQSRFIKSGEAIHVVIGIDPFPFYELKFVSWERPPARILAHQHLRSSQDCPGTET